MLSGIIFVKESIISLDLKSWLSKHYSIVNVFKNINDVSVNLSNIDFIIFDSDPYSDLELKIIFEKLDLGTGVNIINITTHPGELKPQMQIRNSRKVMLPYNHLSIIHAIEAKTFINQKVF